MKYLTRRKFLSLSANGVIAAPFISEGLTIDHYENNLTNSASQNQEPIFRFLQINDLHVQSSNTRYRVKTGSTYKNANLRVLWLLEAINNNEFFKPLDFVISIGDMVHGLSIEGIRYDLEFFKEHFISQLSIPFYPVIGNHENGQQEGNTEFQEPYVKVFGKEKLNYSFIYKGIHFIVLNNSDTWSIRDQQIIDRRKEIFAEMLNREPLLPKFICCHVPFLPLRENKVLAESFGFASYYTKETEFVDMIEQKKDKVLAVLSGHLHLTGVVKVNSIYHISVSGLASYPHDMAVYSVFDDRIEVKMIRVPSDLLEPSTNVHGAGRFGFDFTDELHPDYTTYIMGNPSERRFTIPLRKC